jgi:hypothetical protein
VLAVNTRSVEGFVSLVTTDTGWNRPGGHSMTGHDQIRRFLEYRHRLVLSGGQSLIPRRDVTVVFAAGGLPAVPPGLTSAH